LRTGNGDTDVRQRLVQLRIVGTIVGLRLAKFDHAAIDSRRGLAVAQGAKNRYLVFHGVGGACIRTGMDAH
jgi:hypothetical protein